MTQNEWIEVTEEPRPRTAAGGSKRPPVVNFYAVEPGHEDIDRRLQNWATWSRNRFAPATAPGFENYRSSAWARGGVDDGSPSLIAAVDQEDAMRIARGLAELPAKNSAALTWLYLRSSRPKRMCDHLDVDFQGLYDLVRGGRQALIERK